jgi:4a-hydroxytetrahydrobiopterin dehydratase
MDYAQRHCVPCERGTPRLDPAAVAVALPSLPGWTASADATRLERRYRVRDVLEAMRFVNARAEVAEAEGHHPDFSVRWNVVDVALWTHVATGLTENDFVLAARLDALPESHGARAVHR